MKALNSLPFSSISKSFVFPAIALLLWMTCLAQGNYVLDTFSDDVTAGLPNGAEIGTATYGGGTGVTHEVFDMGSGDLRLRSLDMMVDSGVSIGYFPNGDPSVFQAEYLIRVEGNSNLVGQNAFSQQLVLRPIGANLSLRWGNDHKLYFGISRPGQTTTTNTDTGLTWNFDQDYQVTWFVDSVNDTFGLIINQNEIYTDSPMGVDLTHLYALYFQSNFVTTGSQVIDNIRISRICEGSCTWYVNDTASGSNNGTSWTDAFIKLQDALLVAKASDQIYVAEGSYKTDEGGGQSLGDRGASFSLKNDVAIYGGFDGTESSLSERDWRMNETILSGEIGNGATIADNSLHVVRSNSNDNTAILDGFTITGGKTEGSYPEYIGGGMLLWASNAVINNCKFSENTANTGGGMGITQYGTPSLNNCTFINNHTLGGGGAAIHIQSSAPIMRSCMFLGNQADGYGGAIATMNNLARPMLYNCVFSGNSAGNYGGAISNSNTSISPELVNCTLANNSAGSSGGCINNIRSSDVILNSCILWDNSDSSGNGESAQYVASTATPSIIYSCLQGWSGIWGGAGNIGLDPKFINPDGFDGTLGTLDDDYRLQEDSPAINTGHPDVAYSDPDGSRNDMGAYGGPWADEGGIGVFSGSGFKFTTIGNIPVAEITQDDLDPMLLKGTANVEANIASALSIPAYDNTAFGSSIWIYGLFGDLDVDVDYYQILIGPWDGDTPPVPDDFEPLDDKLTKVLYTYDVGLGEWTYAYIKLGPKSIDGVDDVYQLTKAGFWSHIDLRMIWNTRSYADGKYTLTCKAFHEDPVGTLTDITASLGTVDSVIVQVDNTPVTATIKTVRYDEGSPNWNAISDGEIVECAIINLEDDMENLRFYVTASHSNGYLRHFTLDNIAGKNDNRGVIAEQAYTDASPRLWHGVTDEQFRSEDAPNPPGNLEQWIRCAYQFRLRAYPRVTNGFSWRSGREFSDHYFLDLAGAYGCGRFDFDNSGVVDLLDFAEFASHWLESCSIP